MSKPRGITVLSGGLDSTVATSIYSEKYDLTALTFNYGQQSLEKEVSHAKKICSKLNMKHIIIDLPWLNKISNSTLTTNDEIPKILEKDLDNLDITRETAKSVWVPARNTIFCSIALAYAESIKAEIIIVGWDYEEARTFPDNSKEYLNAFNETIKYGSFDNIKIKAPLIDMTKEDIVNTGKKYNAPMNLSYSCYTGHEKHCGVCESCKRRKRAFIQANINDPTEYEI
ncbi:7-cyano-7-deazaguanine synthase QueC [Methanosphaera sp. WGK6]|uniref:7-cyano-7-deazaguanine synthase QueC n=1 Tax=Methanosphaera sp. WGK6 TaxID=1561964 RepID=UPI00084C019F|nr:7-cyano-7-deazaguanine synthase QueC [Methanosphaera sp. WGK6]OED30440.1 7-cyano-7-deazaguanine synthase [Methanosphaera sp. WGK6]